MSQETPMLLATRELALAQARTLARLGRYAEAEAILADVRDDGAPSVALLDLLARVHAQQGRLEEADAEWAEAERLAPGTPQIAEGRRRIARARARRTTRAAWPAVGAVSAVALVAVVLLIVPDSEDEKDAPAPPPRPSPRTADVLAEMNLRVPGAVVRRSGGELSVAFEKGLFRDGVRLSRDGRAVLTALGTRLRPYATRVSVTVIGHTDGRAVPPGSSYATNTELGTLRATVVREFLHDGAGIPTSRFTVSSLGAASALDQGGSPARNRTAGLRISAVGQG
ncbi:OmpA family protein [Spirillospora sp. CA-294931]|uniref:OmpA family protein n=1 Tax=Spirillospora sp. CA-294931 TaxID=3240042 RepID=UPI003D924B3F